MATAFDLLGLLKTLADIVRDTKDLAEAVKSGAAYLKRKHPSAKPAVETMLSEMRKSVVGLARITAAITHFRFYPSATAPETEAARFNDHWIASKRAVADAKSNLGDLKGSSGKVRKAREELDALAAHGWQSWLRLFPIKSRALEKKLGDTLSTFYADDQRIIAVIEDILGRSEQILNDADAALKQPGLDMHGRINAASVILDRNATAVTQLERDLDQLIKTLDEAILSLEKDLPKPRPGARRA